MALYNNDGCDEGYELVMPFVLAESNGGPYDDEAFTIGYECGFLDGFLKNGGMEQGTITVHRVSIPQLDLIAMRHGYSIEEQEAETEDGFAHMIVTRVTA